MSLARTGSFQWHSDTMSNLPTNNLAACVMASNGLEDEQEHIILHHWTKTQTQAAFELGRLNNAHAQILWMWAQQNLTRLTPEHKAQPYQDEPSLG